MISLRKFVVVFVVSIGLVVVLVSVLLDNSVNMKQKRVGINQNTLRLVTVINRHGERVPDSTYPRDPYCNVSMDPYGWGQLTYEGRRNQYNQGLFLRQRYDKFLGRTYNPDILYLRCTDFDRTKLSIQLEAAGLWNVDAEKAFIPGFPWQPFPLVYHKRSEDMLLLWKTTCPKYTKLKEEVKSLPEAQQINEDNKLLYEELTNFTGWNITSPGDIYFLYMTLKMESRMNFTLPDWTKNYYPDKLNPFVLLNLKLKLYNDLLRRLRCGPLMKRIINNMVAKREGTLEPETRKMFMYVGHSTTVIAVLDGMRVWQDQLPTYNIMVMIELHEDDAGWNVQIFLRNTTTHEPYPLTVPGCVTACPLEDFIRILQPLIPDNWEEECKVDD